MTDWVSTGHQERIDPSQMTSMSLVMDREKAEAIRRRAHYWLAIVAFKVTPPIKQDALLDHESMRQSPVVGCFICEQEWGPDISPHCPGEPLSSGS